MQNETVDSRFYLKIGGAFHIFRTICPGLLGQSYRRHRFSRYVFLTIDIGYRGRFAYVSHAFGHPVSGADLALYPHLAHRKSSSFFDRHTVGRKNAAVCVCFYIASFHSIFVADYVGKQCVVFTKQLSQRGPPIKQELFSFSAAVDNYAGQGRHPRKAIIASSCEELLSHLRRPVLKLCFITVSQDILYPSLSHQASGSLFHQIQVIMEIPTPGVRIQFVHFQPGCAFRCGMILLSGKRASQADYTPPSLRGFPFQDSVLNVWTQIDRR